MQDFQDRLRECMTKDFTVYRIDNWKMSDEIKGLSYDAAVEVARASSIAGRYAISCDYKHGVLVQTFENGQVKSQWIGEKE